jgi:hypothetical protein
MSTIKTFIRKHSVLIYYALTFAISWGGILLVIGGPGAISNQWQSTNCYRSRSCHLFDPGRWTPVDRPR